MSISGQWGIILGASSGMGLASAQKLSRHGMNLVLVHRDRRGAMPTIEAAFSEMAKQVEIIPYNIDALSAESRKSVIDELKGKIGQGKVSLLMHSIAKGNLKRLHHGAPTNLRGETALDKLFSEMKEWERGINYGQNTLNEEDFALTLQSMATSMWSWAKDILAAGLFLDKARVIGLTSEGHHRIWPGYGAVALAKSSMETLAKYMAVELGSAGIRTNVIQAGITPTPSMEMIPGSDMMKASARHRNPLGRLTTPQDVANAVYLLCQPEADWINGTCLVVDGGEHLA